MFLCVTLLCGPSRSLTSPHRAATPSVEDVPKGVPVRTAIPGIDHSAHGPYIVRHIFHRRRCGTDVSRTTIDGERKGPTAEREAKDWRTATKLRVAPRHRRICDVL